MPIFGTELGIALWDNLQNGGTDVLPGTGVLIYQSDMQRVAYHKLASKNVNLYLNRPTMPCATWNPKSV